MLVVVIIALGVSMVLGGGVCIALGAPYLVLEHGFTLTIIGTVLASGGLVLIAAGLLMRDLRRLTARLATRDVIEPRQSPSGSEAGAALGAGLAGAGIAGVATAGAGAALANADDAQAETALDEAGTSEGVEGAQATDVEEGPLHAPEPSQTGTPDFDDTSVEPATAVAAGPVPQASEAAISSDMPALAEGREDDPEEDPFERLRRSLLEGRAQSAASLAAQTDLDHVANVPEPVPDEPFMTVDATPQEAAETPEPAGADKAQAYDAEAYDVEADGYEADGSEADVAEADEAAGPAVSEEGIISVRRIGDATYTMFADGTVLAETPRGARRFASVSDLKAHLSADGA